jgi:GT2 family glycosyltransferase
MKPKPESVQLSQGRKVKPKLPQVINNPTKQKIFKKIPKDQMVRQKEVFERKPYVEPKCTEMSTPSWFRKDENVDVSIIIPMFKSKTEIAEMIESWDLKDDGLTKEIIYVSDACPQKSEEEVISVWSKRESKVGRIYLLNSNSGYSTACNFGSIKARGEYLIFLNADVKVTPNWIRPMYNLMISQDDIGIIGNLQLKEDGSIDSAGSQWMWDNKTFEHIGRNVYDGKRLTKRMTISNAPKELLQVAEREMVTGCCFMIPRKLFEKVGRFDVRYRIGYWEDSDLNMKVKEAGYKIYFQPDSVIYHKSGHSRAGMHPFIMDNVRLFYDRWVNNNKIDEFVKLKRP